ncbi:GNAT family N-acetyltransferase [Flagellimonas nanhaiensis]|uniref:GNAT family N-acetyltransferase n=1 Tax=Flagellimonas nanhaiensis TaxID=2292706 RepID=A0A371JTJ2_9FLAO|nr:GNAT family N-acetyltransferase [Allomuricauda nanhaiensis]RDY61096.1 GNAT family N-acetyltransferase [Allomuricauda nanhaiensis]
MQDMIVRLMELPDISEAETYHLEMEKIIFRRPIQPEKSLVVNWVRENFSQNWADETEMAFASLPANCFIAQRGQSILGFACFEVSAKNFFGPTGVLPSERGKDLGKVLLVKSLQAMKEMGYAYAIIGGVGPASYYKKVVNAEIIVDSEKSIYQNLLMHHK